MSSACGEPDCRKRLERIPPRCGLIFSQPAQPEHKLPPFAPVISQKLRRAERVVDDGRIPVVGGVVKAAPQGEMVTAETEAALQMQVEIKVHRQAGRIDAADDLTLLVH